MEAIARRLQKRLILRQLRRKPRIWPRLHPNMARGWNPSQRRLKRILLAMLQALCLDSGNFWIQSWIQRLLLKSMLYEIWLSKFSDMPTWLLQQKVCKNRWNLSWWQMVLLWISWSPRPWSNQNQGDEWKISLGNWIQKRCWGGLWWRWWRLWNRLVNFK